MDGNCILCGKSLTEGRVNREHYVPQVLIRNFNRLRVPRRFTHALRIDLRENTGQITLAPISCHKEWATVIVHEKCNTDASHMCQDMRYIIDHPHNYPASKEDSIKAYYAHLWGVSSQQMQFENVTDEETDDTYQGTDHTLIYCPGYMWVGKIYVAAIEEEGLVRVANDYEQHTIYLGSEKALERIIDEYRS